jgi:hypothetical protein
MYLLCILVNLVNHYGMSFGTCAFIHVLSFLALHESTSSGTPLPTCGLPGLLQYIRYFVAFTLASS